MTPIIQPASPDHVLVRLTEAEMGDPFRVIEDLCDEYTIGQVRAKLWELIEIALMEDGLFNDAKRRAQLLEWYKMLEKALEGVYLLITIMQTPPVAMEPSA